MSKFPKYMIPKKKKRFKQGLLDPNNFNKVITKTKPIIYRSSYEKKFIEWCENNDNILRWDSETITIPYYLNGKKHTYYPDFYIETKNGNYIIEIKPKNQTIKPNSKNQYAVKEWIKNNHKWKEAIDFCKKRGLEFKIITENTINNF